MSDFEDAEDDGMFDDADDITEESKQLLEQLSIATPVKAETTKTPTFQRAPKFNGSRPGYAFYKGVQGLGYYKDIPLHLRPKMEKVIDPEQARILREPLPTSFTFGSVGDAIKDEPTPSKAVNFNLAGGIEDDFVPLKTELDAIKSDTFEDTELFPTLFSNDVDVSKALAWPLTSTSIESTTNNSTPPLETNSNSKFPLLGYTGDHPLSQQHQQQQSSESKSESDPTISYKNVTKKEVEEEEEVFDPNDKRTQVLIVDSGAFLKHAKLETLGRKIVTIPEVIAELRNKDVREYLQKGVLPYTITYRQPHPKSVRFVSEFAKLTGDYAGLSAVDMKVLALAHTFSVELNGEESINIQPKLSLSNIPVGSIKPAAPQPRDRKESTSSDKSVQDKIALAAAAAWGGVTSKETENLDEQGWISNSNLSAVQESMKKKDAADIINKLRVGCITTDFSMQNVLLQMGINVVSVDGLLIHTIKTFALKCESCFKITHDPSKRFCPGCGLPTLFKITVTSDNDGNISYRLPRLKKTTTRGTRYPLPKMKMGRVNNVVLTEDQKELHRPRKKTDGYDDLLKKDYITGDSPFKMTDRNVNAKKGIGIGGTMNREMKIGVSRNVNAVRKRTGNKKKK